MSGTTRFSSFEDTSVSVTTTTIGSAGPSPLSIGPVTVRSRDEAMDVVVSKIISLLVLTVLSVLCGLLPLRLLIHAPQIFSKNRHPVDCFLCGLRLFSGGIYLATCFLHLLPDTREKMAAVMVNMGSRTTYAVPELLVISGFYAVVFMEQIIKALYVRAEKSDTKRKKKPKRRRYKETTPIFRSTLDEDDGCHPRDHFEMTDEYCQDRNYCKNEDSENDGDDDDDENNVLVEDDEDYNLDSETDSDQYSQSSFTCVKEGFQGKDYSPHRFEDATFPRNHKLSPAKSNTCPYNEVDKNLPNIKSNIDQVPNQDSSVIAVHISTSHPVPLHATDITLKTSSPTIKSIPSPPLPLLSTITIKSTAATTSYCSTAGQTTTTFPSSCNSTTAHVFPSIHHDSECQYKSNHPQKYNQHNSIPTRTNHRQKSILVLNHQPHKSSSHNSDITDKMNHIQNSFYPVHTKSLSLTEIHPLPHVTGQYPKITEPNIQDIPEDKIESDTNNLDNENRAQVLAESDQVKLVFEPVRERDADSGIFSSKRDFDDKVSEGRCQHNIAGHSSENSIDRISECACSLQEFQVQHVVDELTHAELSTSAHFRSIIYIMALAFHGIFEGMALGLQSMKNSVWALCFAIVIHRCVLAFKLGMDLCRGEEKQGTSFLCIGTFTLISALGIIIGILISSGASFYSDVSVPEAILQSLATGTIIYIVFLDILIKDLQGRNDLKRVSYTFVGFSLMAVVFAVTNNPS